MKIRLTLVLILLIFLFGCNSQTTTLSSQEIDVAKEIELRVEENLLQWRYEGETWNDLFDLDTLSGLGIKNIYINPLGELVITYSDDTTENLGSLETSYLVYFMNKDGGLVSVQSITNGEAAIAPDLIPVTGYIFTGWDKSFDNITESIVVQALYEPIIYTAEFISEGNLYFSSIQFMYNDSVDLPLPTREGYNFLGWFTGTNPNSQQIFSGSLLTKDLTLYARWQKSSTITVYNEAELINAVEDYNYEEIKFGNDITISNPLLINRHLSIDGNGYILASNTKFSIINIREKINLIDDITINPNYQEIKISNIKLISLRESVYIPSSSLIDIFGVDNLTVTLNHVESGGMISSGLLISSCDNIHLNITNSSIDALDSAVSMSVPQYDMYIVDSVLRAPIVIKIYGASNSYLYAKNTVFNVKEKADAITAAILNSGGNINYQIFENSYFNLETEPEKLSSIAYNISEVGSQAMDFRNCVFEVGYPVLSELLTTSSSQTNFYLNDSTIILKEGVKAIPNQGFINSHHLANIILPNTLETIGDFAFDNNYRLSSLIIPDSVTSIGTGAFKSCSNLSSIYLPNSIEYVGSKAFEFGYSDFQIYLQAGIDTSGWDLLWNLEGETVILDAVAAGYINNIGYIALSDQNANIVDYIGNESENLFIPDTISFNSIDYTVKNILPFVFYENATITEITLPETIETIGNYAFSYSSKLQSVIIPEESLLHDIGLFAFYNCRNLRSIRIPSLITVIKPNTFNECVTLVTVDLSGATSLLEIQTNAFANNYSLKEITIPDSVTYVGAYAFFAAEMLETINISENSNLSIIDHYAFQSVKSVKSLYIPSSVTIINYGSFSYMSSLEEVIFAEESSLTEIKNMAFSYAVNLAQISLPNTVQTIGSGVFYKCYSLVSVDIPASITEIPDSTFSYCTSLTTINFENIRTLTSIGESAFDNALSLSSFYIPDTVTYVGQSVFKDIEFIVIYCQAVSKPAAWDVNWNIDNQPVVWGYPG